MTRWNTPRILALAMLCVLPLTAQTDEERRLREAMRVLGSGNNSGQGLQESKRKWPAYEREIETAVRDQDGARKQGGTQLEQVLGLFEARASRRDTPVDHYLAGRLLGMMGRLDEARVHFERAIQQDPYFYWAYHGLGSYYANRGMPEPATKRYRRALELNDGYVPSARGLAMCQIQLSQFDGAESTLRSILQRQPTEPDTLWVLAGLLTERTRYLEALEFLNKLDQIEPGREDVSRLMALCYRRTDQVAEAIKIYQDLLRYDPQDYRAHLSMGEILQRSGKNHAAARHYQQALDNLPAKTSVKRAQLQEAIDALNMGPPETTERKNTKSPSEWIQILINSDDIDRKRHAMRVLMSAPRVTTPILNSYIKALGIKDPIIRSLALKAIERNFTPEGLVQLLELLKIMLRDKDARVRGMAAALLSDAGSPAAVPGLIKAVARDVDPYSFRQTHDALNNLTFAYIEVVPPEVMDFAAIDRIRKAWKAWYDQNRALYLKYEDN